MSQRKQGLIPRSFGFAALAVGLLGLGHEASADSYDDGQCVDAAGDFTSFLVFGEECTSPVGFCTRGLLTGDLVATYDFQMITQEPAPTAEHPSRIIYTGVSVVQTENGAMFGEDTGEMWFEGETAFITTVGVVGGDECYVGASGSIVAGGVIDMTTGNAVGTYTATLCDVEACLEGRYCARHGALPGQGNGHGHDQH